jgi:hypothetical protein
MNADPSPSVKHKLFTKVLSFFTKAPHSGYFSFLSLCEIDPDLPIPLYFKDISSLSHLVCLMPPRITDPEAETALLEILDGEEDDDVVEIPPPPQITPRKRRAKKLKEPLDEQYVRRSRRFAEKTGGFKAQSSTAEAVLNPKPLAIVPASAPSP